MNTDSSFPIYPIYFRSQIGVEIISKQSTDTHDINQYLSSRIDTLIILFYRIMATKTKVTFEGNTKIHRVYGVADPNVLIIEIDQAASLPAFLLEIQEYGRPIRGGFEDREDGKTCVILNYGSTSIRDQVERILIERNGKPEIVQRATLDKRSTEGKACVRKEIEANLKTDALGHSNSNPRTICMIRPNHLTIAEFNTAFTNYKYYELRHRDVTNKQGKVIHMAYMEMPSAQIAQETIKSCPQEFKPRIQDLPVESQLSFSDKKIVQGQSGVRPETSNDAIRPECLFPPMNTLSEHYGSIPSKNTGKRRTVLISMPEGKTREEICREFVHHDPVEIRYRPKDPPHTEAYIEFKDERTALAVWEIARLRYSARLLKEKKAENPEPYEVGMTDLPLDWLHKSLNNKRDAGVFDTRGLPESEFEEELGEVFCTMDLGETRKSYRSVPPPTQYENIKAEYLNAFVKPSEPMDPACTVSILLPEDWTTQQFGRFFKGLNPKRKDTVLRMNLSSGKNRMYGLLEFHNPVHATVALRNLDSRFEPQLEQTRLSQPEKGPTKIAEKELKDSMIHLLCGQELLLSDWPSHVKICTMTRRGRQADPDDAHVLPFKDEETTPEFQEDDDASVICEGSVKGYVFTDIDQQRSLWDYIKGLGRK